jgi:hypothetical protein
MAHHVDWMPTTETGIIDLFKLWLPFLVDPGKLTAFHWPATEVTALITVGDNFVLARDAYLGDKSETNKVAKNTAKAAIKTAMRDFATQHIRFNKAMTDADRAAMGIKTPDTTKTKHPAPEARPVFTATANGDGKILVKVEGPWPDNAEEVKYYWEITDEPDPNPKNLRHSTNRNKLKHEFIFDEPDWGKKIHFACAFENGKGDSGPLSSMTSRLVP